MSAKHPTADLTLNAKLHAIGLRIRAHRKALRVSATAAAEASGMSRVTLHRIERGEPSVTIGAYLNATAALGLDLGLQAATPLHPQAATAVSQPDTEPPQTIRLADYPQLQRLAWHTPGAVEVTAQEAFGLYERNWRHIDHAAMQATERALLDALIQTVGKGHLLV